MTRVKNYIDDFLHLLFPHNCLGCGTETLNNEDIICARCFVELPTTGFFSRPGNPVEKIFYGRMPVEHAGSAYYFNKDSLIQHLVIQLKYKNNREAGYYLGRLLGKAIDASQRFNDIDCIIPLPLNEKKLFRRGYNQASLIAAGITQVWKKAVNELAVGRIVFTDTQTHKDRITRWQTMEGVFTVVDKDELRDKHVLLVDDVITTGATIEACGSAILQVPGTKVSIATLAYTI